MLGCVTAWENLPLILNEKDIQMILGISRGKTYEIMKSSDFPTIYIGKRMLVARDEFVVWLSQDRRKIKRRAILCISK